MDIALTVFRMDNKSLAPALSSTYLGIISLEKKMDVISHNLANVNTSGFKKDQVFSRLLSTQNKSNEEVRKIVAENPELNIRKGDMMIRSISKTDFSEGELLMTGNTLDVGIHGDGFFEISTAQGKRYTRSGSFTLNPKGVLTTQNGEPVMGEKGEIVIDGPYNKIEIAKDGSVFMDKTEINKIRIVDFKEIGSLKKSGNNLFEAKISPKAANDFSLEQGFIESSNVNTIDEMTNMINVLRTYESYQKLLQSIDELEVKTINEIGRVERG